MVVDLGMLFGPLTTCIWDIKILRSKSDEWGCAQLAVSHWEGVVS